MTQPASTRRIQPPRPPVAIAPPLLLAAGLLAGCPQTKDADAPAPAKAAAAMPAVPKTDWEDALRYTVQRTSDAVVVEVEIADGFHAYAEGETTGKPLRLALDDPKTLGGPIVYPPGTAKDLPIGRSVIVTGKVQIRAPLASDAAAQTVSGKFHYQVCSDEACDRPRKSPFQLPPAKS